MNADATDRSDESDARILAQAAGRVSDSAGSLVGEVAALRQQLAVTEGRRRRNALGLWLVSAGFALDIALTITMAFVVAGLVHTNRVVQQSLAQNYVTNQQQAQTRVRVLCPLYEVLLAAVANPSPETQSGPAAKARFDIAVKTIKDGYTALGCSPPLPGVTPSGASTR